MSKQLFFEMDFGTKAGGRAAVPSQRSQKRRYAVRRAVLRWLEETDSPTGMGAGVTTRIHRFRADVAAFWSVPRRNAASEGPDRILEPVRTAIVQCYAERDQCWPDCVRSAEALDRLGALRTELAEIEAAIRAEEPGLRESDALFEEFARWDYEASANRRYHQVRQMIGKVEHTLYEGTAFERIRSAQLADRLYLAVPSGLVQPGELADGWGLLWVGADLRITVAAEPKPRECLPANRLHLVQNIAAAAKASQLLTLGVSRRDDEVVFSRPVYTRRVEPKVHLP